MARPGVISRQWCQNNRSTWLGTCLDLHTLESNDKRTSCGAADADIRITTVQNEADDQKRDDVEEENAVAEMIN